MVPFLLPFAALPSLPPDVGAAGFYVLTADADAPAHVQAHFPTLREAQQALRTAYPFAQVLPAEWLGAETLPC